jgi:hypothetical protein
VPHPSASEGLFFQGQPSSQKKWPHRNPGSANSISRIYLSCPPHRRHGSEPRQRRARQDHCRRLRHTRRTSGSTQSALSEGLSSHRHCQLLESAVTHRKQTTDTRSNRHYFHVNRNTNTPGSSRAGHELRITNHESRIPRTHAIIKLSYARHRSLTIVG